MNTCALPTHPTVLPLRSSSPSLQALPGHRDRRTGKHKSDWAPLWSRVVSKLQVPRTADAMTGTITVPVPVVPVAQCNLRVKADRAADLSQTTCFASTLRSRPSPVASPQRHGASRCARARCPPALNAKSRSRFCEIMDPARSGVIGICATPKQCCTHQYRAFSKCSSQYVLFLI